MQILGDCSEEGIEKGLGWIPGIVKKFDTNLLSEKPLLPHLGWNQINHLVDDPILDNFDSELGFYYLHSYHFHTSNLDTVIAFTNYGYEFPAIIKSDNIYGAQFHPEKSHSNGIQFFKNFANL
jgi:glutamine amidotransferase